MRPKHVVYILVDGVSGSFFHDLVDRGRMPFIEDYLVKKGVYAKDCLSCFPANTAPANLAHLTGSYTNHHGVPLIKYWSPDIGKYNDFTKSSLSAIEDFNGAISHEVKTIFEYFSDRTTSMHIVNRGASDVYAGKLRSIYLYLYARIYGWNQLHSLAIKTVLQRLASNNPSKVIVVYLPGPDAISHKLGPNSSEYQNNVLNLDEQIRFLVEGEKGVKGLKDLNILDDTMIVFSSDHGEFEVKDTCPLDKELERLEINLVTGKGRPEQISKADVLMALSGGVAFLSLRDSRTSLFDSSIGRLQNFETNGHSINILEYLKELRGVNNIYLREGQNTYRVIAKRGSARFIRKIDGKTTSYKYETMEGIDPLGYDRTEATAKMVGKGFLTSREWQIAANSGESLDIIDQIPRLFDCRDMKSTIVVTSKRNWSFKAHKGEHDNETNEIRRVPLIITCVGKTPQVARLVRTVDILPTVLDHLNASYNKQVIDGTPITST